MLAQINTHINALHKEKNKHLCPHQCNFTRGCASATPRTCALVLFFSLHLRPRLINSLVAPLIRVPLWCEDLMIKFCLFHRQWGSNTQIFDIRVHPAAPDQRRQAGAPLCQANTAHSQQSNPQPSSGLPLRGTERCPPLLANVKMFFCFFFLPYCAVLH